jgi:hypothetical protein
MDVTITNISAAPVAIGDLYTTIPVGGFVTTKRSASQLSAMVGLQKAVESNLVTVAATLESFESASGLAIPSGTIQAGDVAVVAPTDAAAATFEIRKSFAVGAGGAPDDVTVYAANSLPYKVRVLDAYALVSTAVGASTLQARDQAAGAGQLAAQMSAAATGRSAMTLPTASVVLTPGALIGLFIRRSDSGIAGEVVLTCRRES